jgi:phage shock protein C
MIGGVCGGLAEYFNIDPTIVRLIFVATALLGGPGLLVYLILWIITPLES